MIWPRAVKRRRRWVAAILAGILLAPFVVLAQPGWAVTALGRFFPGMIFRVPTTSNMVALSFDDGPDDVYTARVLEILARHQAHAAFFMIGDRVISRQHIVRAVRDLLC